MTRTLAAILGALIIVLSLGSAAAEPKDAAGAGPDDSRFKGQQLHLLNWADYLDPEIAAAFEKRYGVRLVHTYFETDDHRDHLLVEGGVEGYDLAIVESIKLDLYRRRGWIVPFDRALLPNLPALSGRCLTAAGDAEVYSVPYFWGSLGIAYRSDLIEEPVTSWMQLFRPDERLRGKLMMIDDPVDVLGSAVRALGHSANSEDLAAWEAAATLAREQRPFVRNYGVLALNETSAIVTGDVWMGQVYSGEALELQELNEHIRYVHPEEGSTFWVDHWVLFASSPNRALAHAFLDFINDPRRAATNAQSLYFATCNEAAEALLPAAFRADPVIYPPARVMERLEPYGRLPARVIRKINMAYSRIKDTPAR